MNFDLFFDELINDIDGHGEDDGGVVFGRDGAQSLQIPQLKHVINGIGTFHFVINCETSILTLISIHRYS